MAERQSLFALLFLYGISANINFFIVVRMMWQILRGGTSKFIAKVRNTPPSCLQDNVYGVHGYLKLKDVKLHYVANGEEGKPLMLFLHGFPEFWYSWRHQIKEFCNDYRTVALDMRGYNDSDKPKGVASYSMDKLSGDVKEAIGALGYETCTLVAHDWGGAVAYDFTVRNPTMVDRLITCNIPHGRAFQEHISNTWSQKRKSWYMFCFQMPYIPELLIQQNDYKMIDASFRGKGMGAKGGFTDEDIEAYKYAMGRPGASTASINYYRAAFRYKAERLPNKGIIDLPVCMIWGTADGALEKEMATLTGKYCTNYTLNFIEGASHWVQQEEPEKVNKYMREFLSGKKLASAKL